MMQANNSTPPNEAATSFGLPEGWVVEQRPSTTPKAIGRIDQYYFYEPGTKRKFQSLEAVEKHLDHLKATPSSNSHSSNMPKRKKKKKASFDFANPPEKVTWVLTDAKYDDWCPFINGTKVRDPEEYLWVKTQIYINDARSYKASLS